MTLPTVLYVSHGHPDIIAGGGEQYAFELFQGMREGGRYDAMLVARVAADGTSAPVLHPGTRLHVHQGDPRQYLLQTHAAEFDWFTLGSRDKRLATRDFRELLEAFRPDVVHFQHTAWMGLELVRVARRTLPGIPIVYTLHEFLPICANRGQMVRTQTRALCDHASPRRCAECFPDRTAGEFFLRKRLVQSHLAAVDVFVAPSRQLRDRFIAWGIPADRIRYEEYGRRASGRVASPEPRAKRNRLAYFGQFTPFKGIDVLLKAVPLVGRFGNGAADIQVHLHGAGLDAHGDAFREQVTALLDAAGSHVTLAGRYAAHDLPRLMARTDWVVVPSTWWENSPLVIQEAFAHGRPVICSDIGGMAEKVRHGVDGLHFRVGDAMHLAQTIAQTQREDGLWDRLHAEIRPPHDMPTHASTLADLYDDLRVSRGKHRG